MICSLTPLSCFRYSANNWIYKWSSMLHVSTTSKFLADFDATLTIIDDGGLSGSRREQVLSDIDTDDHCLVLLVSIMAGGVGEYIWSTLYFQHLVMVTSHKGLDITSCNNVILVEPWWNPFVEAGRKVLWTNSLLTTFIWRDRSKLWLEFTALVRGNRSMFIGSLSETQLRMKSSMYAYYWYSSDHF